MINKPNPWPTGSYRLLETAWIAPAPGLRHDLQQAGTVITYAGRPGFHMQPLDEAATKAMARAEAEAAQQAAMWGG